MSRRSRNGTLAASLPAATHFSRRTYVVASLCTVGIVGSGIVGSWLWQRHEADKRVQAASLVRPSVVKGGKAKSVSASAARTTPRTIVPDPVAPVLAAYSAGRFADAEAEGQKVIAASLLLPAAERKAAVRARHLTAFAAARRHDLKLARERFALLTVEASQLPDKGKPKPTRLGADPTPTLEEDGAYQHAVCTSALGDKAGAEREWVAFMKAYPESPLVQASVKRIARLHGGDIPKEAENAWKSAMQTAQARGKARQIQVSRCAPECLLELLKRQGTSADLDRLTAEMKTDERGTSLANLAASARKHGFGQARGLSVTMAGLSKQHFPLIALVSPGFASGHFVLVEGVDKGSGAVRVWNPDGQGVGKPSQKTYSASEWSAYWLGERRGGSKAGFAEPGPKQPSEEESGIVLALGK